MFFYVQQLVYPYLLFFFVCCCLLAALLCFPLWTHNEIQLQSRSNVSYHFSSRFSQDKSFPARRVSFLVRRFSFLSRITEAFSMEYITCKKPVPTCKGRYQSDGTDRQDNKKDTLRQLLASLKIILPDISGSIGRIGWFKRSNSPNFQKNSVLLKFLRCTVNIHLIYHRENFALGLHWQDRKFFEISRHSGECWKVFDISGSICGFTLQIKS